MHTIGYGGESISSSDIESYVAFFKQRGAVITHLDPGYGMSEFGGTVVTTGKSIWKDGSVGVPLPFANVKIVDTESLEELPYGSIGEIWLSSPSMMLEYYQNPEENDKVIVKDENGTRWFKTGDLGEIDSEGFLFLRGRIKRIYLTRSNDGNIYKFFPDYIEKVIREYSPAVECAVIAKRADDIFFVPIAYVASQKEIAQAVHRYCADKLPEYMVPKEIHMIDHIPNTATGKVDYRSLERMASEMDQNS